MQDDGKRSGDGSGQFLESVTPETDLIDFFQQKGLHEGASNELAGAASAHEL